MMKPNSHKIKFSPMFIRLYSFLTLIGVSAQLHAITFYSRVSGSWNNALTWSTVSHTSSTNTGTFPQAGDTVYVANGNLVMLNSSLLQCHMLYIGTAGSIGTVQYESGIPVTLTVTGNVEVNNKGTFDIRNGAPAIHSLNLFGNFINNGIVTFKNSNGGNKETTIRFSGPENSIVSGNGTWTLVKTDLMKSVKKAEVELRSANFIAAISSLGTGFRNVLLYKGTLSLNCAATLNYLDNFRYKAEINPLANDNDLTIRDSVRIKAVKGTINLATSADNVVNLYGDIEVAGGTVVIGGGTGASGGIRYFFSADTANLEVNSGTLNAFGTITGSTLFEPLSFTLTGGVINIGMGTGIPSTYNFQVNSVSASRSVISGGTINILRNTTAAASFALNGLFPANVIVTGGTVVFGNSSTSYIYLFQPYADALYPNMRVSGISGTILKANASLNHKFLSLYIEAGNSFDFTSAPANTLTLTSTYDGTAAFFNSGGFIQSFGTVLFEGITNQSISGTTITTFYNLSTNNLAGVTLRQASNVRNVLTLINGELALNSNTLTIQNNSANAVVRMNTAYVKSETNAAFNPSILKWDIGTNTGDYIFPFGVSATEYIPVTFNKLTNVFSSVSISTRATGIDNLPYATGTNMNSVWGGSESTVIDRWWEVTPSVNPLPAPGADVTFSYRAVENTLASSFKTGAIKVQHWNDTFGWDFPVGGTPGVTSGIGAVTAPQAQSYSPFILVAALAPLPVSLIDFDAELKEGQVNLNWRTASETNNDYFTVEKSADGENFRPVATVKGAGNSNITRSYSATDKELHNGMSYYRLKQTDYDGKVTYSELEPVLINEMESTISIYPNPVSAGTGSLFIKGLSKGFKELKITDVCGRECFSVESTLNGKGITVPSEKLQSLTTGIYFVQVINEDQISIHKIMVE